MNQKGALGVGLLLMSAVAIIVGLALLSGGGISSSVGQATTTATSTNQLITLAANGASTQLLGQKVLGTATVTNRTGGETISTGNYTLIQAVGSDNLVHAYIKTASTNYQSTAVNITYTYEPDGYVSDAAGRSIMSLVLIFSALAICVAAIAAVMNPEFRSILGGR